MTAEELRKSIIEFAIEGKLNTGDNQDESASLLINKIASKKDDLVKSKALKPEKRLEPITEVPFEIPSNWVWIRLGDYCEKITDQVASGSFKSLRENVVSTKIPDYAIMVKTADFANNFSDGLTYTNKKGYDFLNNSNLFGGEMVMSNVGSIGKIFIVPKLGVPMTLAPNMVMLRLPFEELRDYLFYYFQSSCGIKELDKITTSSPMPKINKTDLKTILVPIPPLEEQKRIVKIIEDFIPLIEEYDSLKTQNDNLNDKFKIDIRKSVLRYAMQGKLIPQDETDEPIEKTIKLIHDNQLKLAKNKVIKIGKYDPTIPEDYAELPIGWKYVKIGDISNLVTKQTGFDYSKVIKPSLLSYKAPGTVPLIQTRNFKGKNFEFESAYYVPDHIVEMYPNLTLNKKCLLLSIVGASIGNVGYFDFDEIGFLGGAIAKIDLTDNVLLDYLYYYLQSPLGFGEIMKNYKANAQGTITVEDVRNIVVAFPPLAEQKRIISKLEEVLGDLDQLLN